MALDRGCSLFLKDGDLEALDVECFCNNDSVLLYDLGVSNIVAFSCQNFLSYTHVFHTFLHVCDPSLESSGLTGRKEEKREEEKRKEKASLLFPIEKWQFGEAYYFISTILTGIFHGEFTYFFSEQLFC